MDRRGGEMEVRWTDGEVRWTDGEVRRTDREVRRTDGEVRWTYGEVKWTDGEVRRTDGEVRWADGKVRRADGEVRRTDGEITRHRGAGIAAVRTQTTQRHSADLTGTKYQRKVTRAHTQDNLMTVQYYLIYLALSIGSDSSACSYQNSSTLQLNVAGR